MRSRFFHSRREILGAINAMSGSSQRVVVSVPSLPRALRNALSQDLI